MCQHKTKLLLLFLSLCIAGSVVYADGFVVIVHPSNDSRLDKGTVQRIFLSKEKSFSNGKEAVPINIEAPADPRQAFDQNIIEKNESQIRSYWSTVMFSGKGAMPKEVPDQQEVLKLVASTPNAIGYVSSDQVTDKVKVVLPF